MTACFEAMGKFLEKDLGAEDVLGYADYIMKRGGSQATAARHISSAKTFLAWAFKRGYIYSDMSAVLKPLKVLRATPGTIGHAGLKRLLSCPDTSTPNGMRDRAMMELMISTGIGTSELLSLRICNVDIPGRRISVEGSSPRTLQLKRAAVNALKRYESDGRNQLIAGHADCEAYFVRYGGGSISRQGFWKAIKKYAAQCGVDISPETLRRSFAVEAIKSGESLSSVKKKLGISSRSAAGDYALMALKSQKL